MPKKKTAAKKQAGGMAQPSAYKPPSPSQQLEYSAENMADTAVRNHPMFKKLHAKAKKQIHAAGMKAMRQGPGGLRNVRSA